MVAVVVLGEDDDDDVSLQAPAADTTQNNASMTYGHERADDERVLVLEDHVVRAPEADVQLRVLVLLHVLYNAHVWSRTRTGTMETPGNSIKVYRISVRSQSAFHAVKGSRSETELTHTERFAREPQAAFRRTRGGVVGRGLTFV